MNWGGDLARPEPPKDRKSGHEQRRKLESSGSTGALARASNLMSRPGGPRAGTNRDPGPRTLRLVWLAAAI